VIAGTVSMTNNGSHLLQHSIVLPWQVHRSLQQRLVTQSLSGCCSRDTISRNIGARGSKICKEKKFHSWYLRSAHLSRQLPHAMEGDGTMQLSLATIIFEDSARTAQ